MMLTRKLFTCLMSATVLAGSGLFLTAQDSPTSNAQLAPSQGVSAANFSQSHLGLNNFPGTRWRLASDEQNKFKNETALAVQAFKAAATDDAKSAAKAKLRNALVADYENKMDQYDEHLEKLEAELEAMRERLARRRAAQDDMVDLKLKETIANADGLGWPSDPKSSRTFGRGVFQPYGTQIVPRAQTNPPRNDSRSQRAFRQSPTSK